jgi:hypothetical protein
VKRYKKSHYAVQEIEAAAKKNGMKVKLRGKSKPYKRMLKRQYREALRHRLAVDHFGARFDSQGLNIGHR